VAGPFIRESSPPKRKFKELREGEVGGVVAATTEALTGVPGALKMAY
jgi:hypothetical protein